MTADTVRLYAAYNVKVNLEMDEIIAGLTDEEWNREFGGHYKSIHSLCAHIYMADFRWLTRFCQLRHFNFCKNPIFDDIVVMHKPATNDGTVLEAGATGWLTIFKGSQNIDAAKKLILHLIDPANFTPIVQEAGGLVAAVAREDRRFLCRADAPCKLAGDVGGEVERGIAQQFLRDPDHAAHLVRAQRDLAEPVV